MKVLVVVGTRPNFVKVTQFFSNVGKQSDVDFSLVHTGEHYDGKMSDVFFDRFGLKPDYWLNIGKGSQAAQVAMQLSV